MYQVHVVDIGESIPQVIKADTINKARAIAKAESSKRSGNATWCAARAWNADDGLEPVGGYDADEAHVVIYRER